MSVITQETRFSMAQKRFTGTYQEFDEYYQRLKEKQIEPAQISVVFEIEEPLSPEEEQKKAKLIQMFQETQKSIERGEARKLTPEYFENRRKELHQEYLNRQK